MRLAAKKTSYSNGGQYYTLAQTPEFDGWGLWSFRSVYFSERGTLRATAGALVDESEKGFFATELEALLPVDELRLLGIEVSANTVARLFKTTGFSLRVNHKKKSNGSAQNRNAEFVHIGDLRQRFTASGKPISKNWAGKPLDSYETILNYIRTTKTSTGLRVRSHLVQLQYEKGIKITNEQMKEICITKDDSLPKWNHTIRSAEMRV